MDRYADCFLRKVLWLEDHFHQYYVQERFVEFDDLAHVALRRFDDTAETVAWLQACLDADPFWTMSALRRFLSWESAQPGVHRLNDTQVIAQAAGRICAEPHVVVQEPLLDDRYALQRIQTLTTRLQDQLAVLAKSAPARTQPAPDNLSGLIQAIPAAVRNQATTYAERLRGGAELSILIHDPPLRELLLDFARRYGQGGDGPLDVLAGLLCGQGPKPPSQSLTQTRHLLTQIAAELKPLRVRDPLPKKEFDPLALVHRKTSEPQKNWVDLDYRYADGTGVAGAKYEVFDAGGAKLAAGTLGGDGTARASIPLAVSHVQARYFDDPRQIAILKASHPTPYPAPPGWQTRMTADLQSAWQTTKDAGIWTWGMLQGDFNEDPTVGQIITNAVVTAIPVVDQVGDARDIAAGVKMLAWDQRYDEPGVWMDNGFTLVGLFPGVGSLLKGVLKLVDKLAGLDQILAVYNHFMKGNGVKWLKELKAGKLKAYYDQAATKAHAIFAAAIDNLVRLKQHMPRNLAELHARADSLLAALRRTKAMINDQFRRMGRELAQKLETILAKRTDELPAGPAKGKVPKQQRAEAPEGDSLSIENTTGESEDFVGTLRGEPVRLKGVKTQKVNYTKRSPEETAELRKQFNNAERKNFLSSIGNDPAKIEQLKLSGLNEKQIAMVKNGGVPPGWQVHHKLPLDDGGTNALDNMILIKNDPYHMAVTNAQKELTKGLGVGQARVIEFPVPDGFIYPK
jgi:hypothetical protein